MENNPDTLAHASSGLIGKWGFWAVIAGAVALVLVFAQIALPSLTPQPSVGSQIGEIAGDIKRSAWRSFLGLSKPEPEVIATPVWAYLALIAPIFGVLAICLAVVSAVLRENRRFAVYATTLGVSAIAFQIFWWLALLIIGFLLIAAILENMSDIFSF